MADKKKMSVADILAAARKMDSGSEATAPAESATVPPPIAPTASKATPPPAKAPSAPAKSTSGGRPNVAEMLAMARGETAKGTSGETAKPAPPKPAAKSSPKAAESKAQVAAPSKPAAPRGADQSRGPLDTTSILASARKADKAGPVSKAEAARLKSDVKAPLPKQSKTSPEVSPMPLKPSYAQRPAPKPAKVSTAPAADDRRGFLMLGWGALAAVGALWTLATARFMYPNVLREPPNRFKVGFLGDFAPGTVEEKFKAQFGVWVVNTEFNGVPQLFALKSVCTHLGCTPNWLEAEQKFKCPCHGSGFYKDGINFEGPAPRPLERYVIRIADDGQVEIDKSRIFQEEMGQWADPSSFIPV